MAANYTIYHDLYIEKPIKSVFKVVSDPKELENWWPLKCKGEPTLNSIYNFYFGPEYNWYGKVIKYEPSNAFHIKMTQSDADWDPTSFGFDLEEINKGTRLKFWHKGWTNCNHHYRHSSYCWAILLKGLKDYLEKGIVIPFEKRK
ncbi:SRPBCC family protein [Flavobacteriaceae bacterium M23B6Z8]